MAESALNFENSLRMADWVLNVEKSLTQGLKSDGYHDIHCLVPKSLKNANTEIFYIPQVISLGPNHFPQKSPLYEVEVLKLEAARKHNHLLTGGLKCVVQSLMAEDIQKIREIYGGLEVVDEDNQKISEPCGKGFPRKFPQNMLLWMLVTDGCFLIEILNGFSKNGESNGQEIQDGTTLVIERSTTPEEKKGDSKGKAIRDLPSPVIEGSTTPEEKNGEIKRHEKKDGTATVIEESTTPTIERILKRRYHPLLNDIVKDMFKMENQVPLLVLNKIVGKRFCVLSALKRLSPIEVNVDEDIQNDKQHHILQLLHDYMVGKVENMVKKPIEHNEDEVSKDETVDEEDQDTKADNVDDVDQPLREGAKLSKCPRGLRLSPLNVMKRIWRVVEYPLLLLVISPVLISLFAGLVVIILVLSPVLILLLAWFVISVIWELYQEDLTSEARKDHVPTLEELKRLGVKFNKLQDKGIYHIKFEESNSTLYLPRFKVDDRSEVILRNLIALEMCSDDDEEKPITRYAFLMNDLVNTSADVAILRRQDIITSKLGSDEDVAKLLNSVVVATDMPTCKPIDEAATSINCYCKKWWKVLWAQFKMLHCSKPWLVLSLLGGISLLMLTVVQVVCLFSHCDSK